MHYLIAKMTFSNEILNKLYYRNKIKTNFKTIFLIREIKLMGEISQKMLKSQVSWNEVKEKPFEKRSWENI